jgi:PLD-like domain
VERWKFLSPQPMKRLRELADKSIGHVAVPFLGADAATRLPLKKGSVLVTRVTEEDVRRGLVSPREILRYLDSGVEVHSCKNLHAKVYVFDRRAIVGSANISATSENQLMEAAIEVNLRELVVQAKQFVHRLRVDHVSPAFVQSLEHLYRQDCIGGWSADRVPSMRSRSTTKVIHAIHSRMWVMPVRCTDWGEESTRAAAAGRECAQERLADGHRYRLDEIDTPRQTWTRLSRGDRVIQRLVHGRGFLYSPPARIVHIEPVGNGRSAVVFLECRKRLRQVSSTKLRHLLGALAAAFTNASNRAWVIRNREAAAAVHGLWPILGHHIQHEARSPTSTLVPSRSRA